MPRSLRVQEIYRLTAGRDDKSDAIELPPNKFQELKNVITIRDSIHKRGGYAKEYTTALNSGADTQRIHQYEDNSQNLRNIYAIGGNLFRDAMDDNQPTDITGGLTLDATRDALYQFINYDGRVIGTDNVNPIFQIPSITDDAEYIDAGGGTDIPKKAGCLALWYGFIIAADVVEFDNVRYPYRIRWHSPPEVDIWPQDRQVDLNRNQKIVSMRVHGEYLIIFQERTMWIAMFNPELGGLIQSEFSFKMLDPKIGAVGDQCVVQTERGLFWVDRKGIYFMAAGSLTPEYVGKPNETMWANLNLSRLKYGCGADLREKNAVVFTLPTGSGQVQNNVAIFLNYEEWARYGITRHPAFSLWEGSTAQGFNFNSMADVIISDRDRVIAGGYDGFVYLLDEGTEDNGQGIESQIKTAYLSPHGRGREKIWYQMAFDVDMKTTKTVSITYRIFNDPVPVTKSITAGNAAAVLGAFTLGTSRLGNDDLGRLRGDLSGRSRYIEIDMTIGTDEATFALHGILVYYKLGSAYP